MSERSCTCGRPARPLLLVLLGAPLIVGGLAAAALLLLRGEAAKFAGIAVTVLFAGLAGGLLWFGLRVLKGLACAGCGRRAV